MDYLVEMIIKIVVLIMVIGIVIGLVVIISMYKTEPEKDFKRIIDPIDNILKNYDKKQQHNTIEIPIVSKHVFEIAFYPQNYEKSPKDCEKQTCICIIDYNNNYKQTCSKLLDIKNECYPPCGKTICAKEYYSKLLQKGQTLKVGLQCTDEGTRFIIT